MSNSPGKKPSPVTGRIKIHTKCTHVQEIKTSNYNMILLYYK